MFEPMTDVGNPRAREYAPMDYHHRIRPARHPVEGTLRLAMTSGSGLLIGFGEISDISADGCAIRVNNRKLEPNLHGRIDLTIAGEVVALPVMSRWVRAEPDGLVVGCTFDGLTDDTRRLLNVLLTELTAKSRRPGRRALAAIPQFVIRASGQSGAWEGRKEGLPAAPGQSSGLAGSLPVDQDTRDS